MKGYSCGSKPRRHAPKISSTENREKKLRKRKQRGIAGEVPTKKGPLVEEDATSGGNSDFEYPASSFPPDNDAISKSKSSN